MPNGRTLDLIIHGSRADNADLREAAEWARAMGHRVRAQVTWEAGDARRFAALRGAVGVVTQDGHLFHDTVAGNLRYAKPDANHPAEWACPAK